MNLINHSMHWGWKVSFIVATFLIAAVWINELFDGYTDEAEMVFSLIPMAVWLMARWISMGETFKSFAANHSEMGVRLFLAGRWAFFVWYCSCWLAGLLMSRFPSQVLGSLVLFSGLVLLAQWIMIGQVRLEAFLPWTKLRGSEVEAKEG